MTWRPGLPPGAQGCAAAVALLLCGCGDAEPSGSPARSAEPPPAEAEPAASRWRLADDGAESDPQAEALASLGYAAGSVPARVESGVTLLEESAVSPGWNLYTSGHGPVAILMDANGQVLHQWERRYLEVWPTRGAVRKPGSEDQQYWRRARLLPDGGLLAIFEGEGLVRLDRDSNVLWSRHQHAHHDVGLHPSGEIWVLERRARVIPGVNAGEATVEDLVTVLAADGTPLRTVSLIECFERSPEHDWRAARDTFLAGPAATVLEPRPRDVFHTNSIQILGADDGPGPTGPGRALLSFRHLNTIAVVDVRGQRVTWSLAQRTTAQHEARRTPQGTITAFDNLWRVDRSRVVELDPETGATLWECGSAPDEAPFFSRESGGTSLLENGNLLVVETDPGRAFEVTRAGRRVWEFSNPHRAGENDEYVAAIFGMERVSEASVRRWWSEGESP